MIKQNVQRDVMKWQPITRGHEYCDCRNVTMNLHDGYVLNEVIRDTNGNLVDFRCLCVNPAFERLTGISSDKIVGETAYSYLSSFGHVVIELFSQVATSCEEVTCNNYFHSSGRYFNLKIWSPVVGLLSCLVTDVTEKMQTETSLMLTERAKLLYNQLETEGIFVLSSEGVFLEVNRGLCQMSGFGSSELKGAHLSILQAGGIEAVNARLRKIMREGRFCYETRYSCRNGRELDVEVSAQHFPGEAGEFVMIVRNNTERKDFQQKAVHAAHLATVGEFSAGIAHEINNPITGVINCAELLISRNAVEDKSVPIVKMIIREGRRIANIVHSLLFFSRDSGDSVENIEINKLLADVITLSADQLVKDNIELQLDLEEDPINIMVNPQKFEQIILNLISNSRYALNERNKIKLDEMVLNVSVKKILRNYESTCRITVRDNGTGIPPDVLEKIGRPFFSTKPAGIGTGLGLSICKGFIRDFGGELTIASKNFEFTEITIDLPVT